MDWITDRPPTRADGDSAGRVVVLLSEGKAWYAMYYSEAAETGLPWLSFAPLAINDMVAAVETGKRRRIVSISRTVYGATHTIDAVADDGTAWWKVPGGATWTQLPALPDRG